MTNREQIIKQLQEHDLDAGINFMCPCIPGEKHAHCKNTEESMNMSLTECKVCINEWLDREVK